MFWIQNFVSSAHMHFLFVTLHCLVLQNCYKKFTLHCTAPQHHKSKNFLLFKFFVQAIFTVVLTKVGPLYFRLSNSKPTASFCYTRENDTLRALFGLASQQAVLNFSTLNFKLQIISINKTKKIKSFNSTRIFGHLQKQVKIKCKIVALSIMPPNVFLQVKKINTNKNVLLRTNCQTSRSLVRIQFEGPPLQ